MTPPTVSIPTAAKLLGIGTSTAYEAARNGTFPTKVIRVGSRYVVPTKPLLNSIGLDELPATA